MKTLTRLLSILLLLSLMLSTPACGTDPQGTTVTHDTAIPSAPAEAPAIEPTEAPTAAPTEAPTTEPTEAPTTTPNEAPTTEPTEAPTTAPIEAPTTEPTEAPTVHSHDFSAATCTDPEICATCGETRGQPAGHDWDGPTCLAPMTCTACGTTKGSALDHDYENGSCRYCGKDQPSSGGSGPTVWIPTKGGKKYHSKSSCSNMKDPRQVTVSEAEDLGFTPCKKCY